MIYIVYIAFKGSWLWIKNASRSGGCSWAFCRKYVRLYSATVPLPQYYASQPIYERTTNQVMQDSLPFSDWSENMLILGF
jgi:hypothetical protein